MHLISTGPGHGAWHALARCAVRTGRSTPVPRVHSRNTVLLSAWLAVGILGTARICIAAADPAVRAFDFESRVVYRSKRPPGYACWVSFFPGENGQWYIGCEEVSRPDPPLARSPRSAWYEMMLPVGYDKSQYLMEAVILESGDDFNVWREVSRQTYRHRHTVGQFAQARTRDGRFLRFIWSCYSLELGLEPNEIFYQSGDDGRTWTKMPAFHHERFVSYPHRLRTLRDGTLVLCMPLEPRWGKGTDRPVRTCSSPYAVNEMQMSLFFSFDQGQSWDGPLPIYGGTTVSETDFVELPSGDLLCINNKIFANAGRQSIYRDGRRFTPGPQERARSGTVPETVCLTPDGILIGCHRPGTYSWSDDLGQTWQPLAGVPTTGEVYQPWIHSLADGRIACAGHNGSDTPISVGRRGENHVNLHLFRVEVLRKTKEAVIAVERVFDPETQTYPNAYRITLASDGQPLPDRKLVFKIGAEAIPVRTDNDGVATVALTDKDSITDVHSSYGFVVQFNMDHTDPEYKPTQSQRFSFYARYHQDPPLK